MRCPLCSNSSRAPWAAGPQEREDRPAGRSHQWLPAGLWWPRRAPGGSEPPVWRAASVRSPLRSPLYACHASRSSVWCGLW